MGLTAMLSDVPFQCKTRLLRSRTRLFGEPLDAFVLFFRNHTHFSLQDPDDAAELGCGAVMLVD